MCLEVDDDAAANWLWKVTLRGDASNTVASVCFEGGKYATC